MSLESSLLARKPGALRDIVESAHGTIDEAALVIASDAYPALTVDRYRARLDDLAEKMRARLCAPSSGKATGLERVHHEIEVLRSVLYDHASLRGNVEDYYDPRNSYLNEVLDRGLGIPISLAVVVLAVTRRADIIAEGIGFPGHFVVRVGGPGGLIVDPFNRLDILSHADLTELARRTLGANATISPHHLNAIDMRAMVIRMLTNLRAIHEQRKDHRSALVVCDRLVELSAGAPAIRDRGLHALALGAGAVAKSDLATYLKAAPHAPDRREIERALAGAERATTWN